MKSLAQARMRRTKALELAAQGLSYDEIARRAGFAHRGSAHRAVFKALDAREAENVDQLRALELDRLDALQASNWEKAVTGDHRSVLLVLRVIEARIRVLGLDRKHAGDGTPSLTSLLSGPAEPTPGG
jgi:hypothetical protein